MAPARKKPARKPAKSATRPAPVAVKTPSRQRVSRGDWWDNAVRYAQENPSVAVVGIIVVLVALVLLLK
jgi:hypothetical protein